MPVSKHRKRKRGGGTHGRVQRAMKRIMSKSHTSTEEMDRDIKTVLDTETRSKGHHLFASLFVDENDVEETYLKAISCLNELNETDRFSHFSTILTMLMNGALLHQRLGISEKDVLDDLGFSAYMLMTACRIRCQGQHIPQSTLDTIRQGVDLAQEIILLAFNTDRVAYSDMLRAIDVRFNPLTSEQQMLREKYLFGKYHDTVIEWEKSGAFCAGVLKPSEDDE